MSAHPWEVKLVVVCAVYCLFKRFPSEAVVLISRCLFVFGHVLLLWQLSRFNGSVMSKSSWSMERKEKARVVIQKDLFRPLLIRAVLVAIIHWKFNLNPPLLVSVAMGLFSYSDVSRSLITNE